MSGSVCSKNRNRMRVDPDRNRTEPAGRTDGGGTWGDTDLAWRRSSPFHKSGVPLGAQTRMRVDLDRNRTEPA